MKKTHKTIFITGATDGLGLETARKMSSLGHRVIVHGRNEQKLKAIRNELQVSTFRADFSQLHDVPSFAQSVLDQHPHLDVLINNAGVYKTKEPLLSDGMDVRFVVNTLTPYILTKLLRPALNSDSRVINLSSAAQSPVDFEALKGSKRLDDFEAYAQSKLSLKMWSRHLAHIWQESGGPVVISVNPGSLLATKMVRDGFGVKGNDLNLGVDILLQLSLEKDLEEFNGQYYDNDSGKFQSPQKDGLKEEKIQQLISVMESLLPKTH